jgi:hypothetical protein
MVSQNGTVHVFEGDVLHQPRQGKSCFGCCNMRRAVIITDGMNLILLAIQLYLYNIAIGMTINDPEYAKKMHEVIPHMIATTLIKILFVLVAIVGKLEILFDYLEDGFIINFPHKIFVITGAIQLSSKKVFAGVFVYAMGVIVSIGMKSMVGLLINLLFGVPHVLLCMKINR